MSDRKAVLFLVHELRAARKRAEVAEGGLNEWISRAKLAEERLARSRIDLNRALDELNRYQNEREVPAEKLVALETVAAKARPSALRTAVLEIVQSTYYDPHTGLWVNES